MMEKGKWKMEKGSEKMESVLHSLSSILHSPFSIIHDRRGSVAAQAILLLPLFVLVVFGGYETLKIMSVKQALHNGTYQAVRYLALNPINSQNPRDWEDVARAFIEQELAAEIGDEYKAHQVQVRAIPPRRIPPCFYGDTFSLRSTLRWDLGFAPRLPSFIQLNEEYRNTHFVCH